MTSDHLNAENNKDLRWFRYPRLTCFCRPVFCELICPSIRIRQCWGACRQGVKEVGLAGSVFWHTQSWQRIERKRLLSAIVRVVVISMCSLGTVVNPQTCIPCSQNTKSCCQSNEILDRISYCNWLSLNSYLHMKIFHGECWQEKVEKQLQSGNVVLEPFRYMGRNWSHLVTFHQIRFRISSVT